jgi:nucleotide-binding universal stress UspA family protein
MKILIVTDGSLRAEDTIRFGAQFVPRVTEPPAVLVVLDTPSANAPIRPDFDFSRICALLGESNISKLVRIGDLAEQILQELRDGSYDLVIIADWPQKNLLKRVFRRSIALRIAEHAPCSVIIVKGSFSPIKRILLCDHGSGRSALLSRLVLHLANLLEGEEDITILHVMSQVSAWPGVRGKQLRAGAQELIDAHSPEGEILERDVQLLDHQGIHPKPKVRHGLVVDEILAEARGGDYDLVVVGAHQNEGLLRFLLENIAHQVITKIQRPILVVRQKKHSV